MAYTILVADDGPFIGEALCNVFEREGALTFVARRKTERRHWKKLKNCTLT
jgi:hypothetical protein